MQFTEQFELIEEITGNPARYLDECTLECLRAFLKGYFRGRNREQELIEFDQEFSRWYSKTFRLEPEIGVWRDLVYSSADRFAAIQNHWEWIKKFKNHIINQPDCNCDVCTKVDSDYNCDGEDYGGFADAGSPEPLESLPPILDSIREHPLLHLPERSIQCLQAFLIAFPDEDLFKTLRAFNCWAGKYYRTLDNRSWASMVALHSTDDHSAFLNAFGLIELWFSLYAVQGPNQGH